MTHAIVVGAVLAAVALIEAHQPVFRTRTDLVRVDVLVTDGGVPSAGSAPPTSRCATTASPSAWRRQRPTLLLVMTDGRNNASWLRATDVVDVARRLEAALYPVAVGVGGRLAPLPAPGPGGGAALPRPAGVDREWRGIVSPALRTVDSLALLRLMAEGTGGRHLTAQWDTGLSDVFRGILAEYRQRYILSFTPDGVGTADGWHTLDVRVKRRGLGVRSRTRYWAG